MKAITIGFGTWLLAPLTFLVLLLLFGTRPAFVQVVELYSLWGYSYVFYVLASVISILPVNVLTRFSQAIIFIAFLAAAVLASFTLIINFASYMQQFQGCAKHVLLGLIVAWQVIIFFCFKYAFFGH